MKAVIFDMDGVIIDSESIHQQTELNALTAFGLTLQKEDLYPYAGRTRDAFQQGIAETYNFHPDWNALFAHKDRNFYELMQNVHAMPGVLDLIHDIHSAGLLLGLATSGQKPSMELVLQKFDLYPLFSATVCASDITHSKPHPEIFLMAAQRLAIEPSDCAVFEDSISGIRAAKSAGMYTIGISTSFPRGDLHEADRIIDAFPEINAQTLRAITV